MDAGNPQDAETQSDRVATAEPEALQFTMDRKKEHRGGPLLLTKGLVFWFFMYSLVISWYSLVIVLGGGGAVRG